ncbi:MAG: metal ABC transporter permease [Spirochaetaceae bacterium]|nr:metal ABC transporter permease [Spirochaetaceae bacterium]
MIEKILEFSAFPFVQNALIVGALIALCSSLFGTTLILQRFSFIGDGLSHLAFGVFAIAGVLKIVAPMTVVIPVMVISAILLLNFGKKIGGDVAIAMISVGMLGIGYLVLSIFSPSSNISGDVCNMLFGTTAILTLSSREIILCACVSLTAVLIFIFGYHRIFTVSFDFDFAQSSGINAGLWKMIIASVVAVVIVLAMTLVGSLLVCALIVFPGFCAMQVCRRFKSVTVVSALIGVFGTLSGLLISIGASSPVGPTIVCVFLIVLFAVLGVKKNPFRR